MMQKTIIFFDLDGTLLDTAPDLLQAFNLLLQKYDKPTVTLGEIRHLLTHGSSFFIKTYFSNDVQLKQINQLREEFLDIYSSLSHNNTQLFPGMLELLNEISNVKIPWGIVTNKLAKHTQENLANLVLPSEPQVIVCGDTLSVAKPDPAPLLHACKLMGVEPNQVIFIGDSDVDALTGQRAKIDTVIVSHGYNSGIEQFSDLAISAWIQDPLQVMEYFHFGDIVKMP